MHSTAAWTGSSDPSSEYRVISSLTHPLSQVAWRFWEQRPEDGIVIGRDIPSRAIAKLLSHVLVYRPTDEGQDFVVHVAGDSIRRRFPRNITGMKLTDLYSPGECTIRYRTFVEVLAQGEPQMASISHTNGSLEILHLELLVLPAYSPDRSEKWPVIFGFYF